MSSTPPVLVVCSHNQFMTQNSHNSRTSNSSGNPVPNGAAAPIGEWKTGSDEIIDHNFIVPTHIWALPIDGTQWRENLQFTSLIVCSILMSEIHRQHKVLLFDIILCVTFIFSLVFDKTGARQPCSVFTSAINRQLTFSCYEKAQAHRHSHTTVGKPKAVLKIKNEPTRGEAIDIREAIDTRKTIENGNSSDRKQ
jgi:hypothetical protein